MPTANLWNATDDVSEFFPTRGWTEWESEPCRAMKCSVTDMLRQTDTPFRPWPAWVQREGAE